MRVSVSLARAICGPVARLMYMTNSDLAERYVDEHWQEYTAEADAAIAEVYKELADPGTEPFDHAVDGLDALVQAYNGGVITRLGFVRKIWTVVLAASLADDSDPAQRATRDPAQRATRDYEP